MDDFLLGELLTKYARLQFFLQFHHETFALPVTFSHISGWEDGITAWNPFLQTSGRDDTGWSILQFYVSPRFGDIYLERSNTPPTKTATFFPPPPVKGMKGSCCHILSLAPHFSRHFLRPCCELLKTLVPHLFCRHRKWHHATRRWLVSPAMISGGKVFMKTCLENHKSKQKHSLISW